MADQNDTDKLRVFARRPFGGIGFNLSWMAFCMFLTFLCWPLRNFVLVCWVYGSHAYFQEGIRVLNGKPTRFSNGELALPLPDMVTGLGVFLVATSGSRMLVIFLARYYERHSRKSKSNDL